MIVKKILAPLVNNKILKEAVHCSIATAAITEPAFDLLMSMLPPKCNVDIVTGLDLPTDPEVLRKVIKQYPGRVTFRIYTKNFFHPGAYIIDLPYRKMVAFIGSGHLTMGGLKDHEELFYRIDIEKSVEEVKSWFRSYFEYGADLNLKIVEEYEKVFPFMQERERISRQEKQQLNDMISGVFNWSKINFKNQYFTQDDYAVLDNSKAPLNDNFLKGQRMQLRNKLLDLHERLKNYLSENNFSADGDQEQIVSSIDPVYHPEHKLRSMWLGYGRVKKEPVSYQEKPADMAQLQVILRQQETGLWLVTGTPYSGIEDRKHFRNEMQKEDYRKKFFELLKKLDKEYWLEVSGEKRLISTFSDPDDLVKFTDTDSAENYFIIGRSYAPGDTALDDTMIISTIQSEFDKLIPLFKLVVSR
jgi:HKD family nuclease